MGSVLSSRLSSQVEIISQANGTSDTSTQLAELARHPDVIIDPTARAQIPPVVLQHFKDALDHALHSVFLVGLVVAVLALVSAFLVPGGIAKDHAAHRD